MNSTRTRGHARHLTRTLARDLRRARTLAQNPEHDRILLKVLELARALDRDSGDPDLSLPKFFDRDDGDLLAAAVIANALDSTRANSSGDFGRLLDRASARAVDLVHYLEAVDDQLTGNVRPSKVSRQLAVWAARVLPAADRPEYAEVFQSELFELANSGSTRRAQFAYAIRVLVRAPLLRRELRAPAKERSW